jgi:hypothetical protein
MVEYWVRSSKPEGGQKDAKVRSLLSAYTLLEPLSGINKDAKVRSLLSAYTLLEPLFDHA